MGTLSKSYIAVIARGFLTAAGRGLGIEFDRSDNFKSDLRQESFVSWFRFSRNKREAPH